MGLNWVEDIVSHLYKLKGYMVIENEDLQMPKTEYRKVRGHSDIDIIAIKDKELIHVECQTCWVPKREDKKYLRQLGDRFEQAPCRIFEKYEFLKRDELEVKNIFVTSGKPKKSSGHGPWDRLEKFCGGQNIELREINSIIRELIEEFKKRYPKPEKVGKEEGISRFLVHLIHNDFLQRPQE